MNTSTEIKNIAAALIGFQKEVGKIKKDANNPFFKSKYATLSGILEAISGPLVNNGLSVVQFPEGENGLTTRLMHTSGEWMESTYSMPPIKNTPQDRGSAITYQRRYAIGAILCLQIDDDDDGNAASRPAPAAASNKPAKANGATPAPARTPEEVLAAWRTAFQKLTTEQELNAFYTDKKEKIDRNPQVFDLFMERKQQLQPQTAKS